MPWTMLLSTLLRLMVPPEHWEGKNDKIVTLGPEAGLASLTVLCVPVGQATEIPLMV